jgi:hypothetical protein
MPVDITSVTVMMENGIKREEYGPTRKAAVSLTAAVDKGDDGVVAMNYLGTLVRAKVAEMLGLEAPAAARATLEPAATEAAPAGETQRRKRRTNAEIAADEAAKAGGGSPAVQTEANASTAGAASASGGPAASTDGAASGEEWSEETLPPTSSASPGYGEDWSDAAPAPAISDADLAMHCSKHAQRLGGGEKVKAAIVSFKPDAWTQPKFGVTDIPQDKRPHFVAALEALTA